MSAPFYPFQSSDLERRRLIEQNRLVAPLTRRLFERAGISAGMTVLDIGSGSGDVSFLAAQMVGPTGRVLGIDRDPAQVRFAEQRAKAEGIFNVDFTVAELQKLQLKEPVDAIVGRLVLMYAADPVVALRDVARNLKTGGVIALQESIIDYDAPVPVEPRDCLAARAVEWFRSGFKHAGVQPRMGLRLFGVMRAAGFSPSPDIDMLMPLLQGPDGPLFGAIAAVVRSQIPAIVASGAASEAEIDIETLEQRMIADAPEGGVVGYFNSGHVGVWARKT
ncbi:MAG TPA: class I SAM-dependent methyltransferase [Xanthobacteraceae bacterium]|nr:class I SAM-dependent methyltransferase [Xanthobacteraceae bacterium]